MVHCYREFPNMFDEVPRIGVMGPWAMRSGRRDGMNDGERGEAQGRPNELGSYLTPSDHEREHDGGKYYDDTPFHNFTFPGSRAFKSAARSF